MTKKKLPCQVICDLFQRKWPSLMRTNMPAIKIRYFFKRFCKSDNCSWDYFSVLPSFPSVCLLGWYNCWLSAYCSSEHMIFVVNTYLLDHYFVSREWTCRKCAECARRRESNSGKIQVLSDRSDGSGTFLSFEEMMTDLPTYRPNNRRPWGYEGYKEVLSSKS